MGLGLRLLLLCIFLFSGEVIGAGKANSPIDNFKASLRNDLEKKATSWQVGVHGVSGLSTDDVNARHGIGLLVDNDILRPIVFQLNFSACFSKFKTIFPGQRFISGMLALDIFYRFKFLKASPYFGVGFGRTSNSQLTGRPAAGSFPQYDETTPAETFNFGSRKGFHATIGVLYQISKRYNLLLDLRRSATLMSTPVLVTRFPFGTTTREMRDYRIGAYSIRLGIVARIYK